MKEALRCFLRWLFLTVWRPARIREGDRLLRQLSEAAHAVPSKHDDPEYSERFLRALFTGTYARGQLHGRMGATACQGGRGRSTVAQLDALVEAWLDALTIDCPVSRGADLRDLLRRFALELAEQVSGAVLDDRAVQEIGVQLATSLHIDQVSFRRTIELLTPFLQAVTSADGFEAGEGAGDSVPRWIGVLAEVVEGYTAGTRDRALGEQAEIVEALSNARAKHWRALVDDADRFEKLLTSSPVAMGLLDTSGRVIEANEALAAALNRPLPAVRGTDLTLYLGGEAHALIAEHMFAAILGGKRSGSIPAVPLAATGLEQPKWMRLLWAMPARYGERIRVVLEDVTEHHLTQRWLEHKATHDHVSGLPNRRYLEQRLDHLLSGAPGTGTVGIYAIRLDGLVGIAETFGRIAGADALRALTARATQAAASTDLLAQLDPTTFAVVVIRPESWVIASNMIRRLVERLADPLPVTDGTAVCITPTVGAAHGVPGRTTVHELMHSLGRSLLPVAAHDRTTVVETTRRDRDQERNQLLAELPAALGRGEVTILHAPIARADTGHIVGAHAIPSWTHPGRRTIPVTELINLATAVGLSAPVVPWCLDRALADAMAWRATLGGLAPFLRVDLPARCTVDKVLVDEIFAVLDKHRFPASRLQLAVWESSIIDPYGEPRREIIQLTSRGVRLYLNDLGAGVGRFDLLPRLYLQGVTIAARLTAELERTPAQSGPTTLKAMIDWGTHLKVDVDLRDINDEYQRDLACRYGATNIQGHVVGDPQTPADLEQLINDAHRRPCAAAGG
ncbi:MAG TPA: EAL domain-containing protein [Actinophytocola sp.]|uniref:EAL domain-containing protein n=1 Tax=Actinophytocola sp. TaxID=1872138 RepID=UPI002DDC9C86|nr:EAL domain-containing protein [Actinophytocola sp.]HEV2779243.1 EAL domain-containing protein [Actinophytocola sp.]